MNCTDLEKYHDGKQEATFFPTTTPMIMSDKINGSKMQIRPRTRN